MHKAHIYYIDNLRIFLTTLVVLFHLITAYGAPGGWYYVESTAEFPEIIPMSMFITANQAFLMGMFFLISSFFLLPSLTRKGPKLFIKERLIRLGVPLVVFYFLLGPLTSYIRDKYIYMKDDNLLSFITNPDIWYFGPMWFVEALLIFTILFFLVRRLFSNVEMKFPGTYKILLFAFIIALAQFIMRIWLPARWTIPFTNLRITFFVQYIALFTIGIIANQNNWFDSIKTKISWRWFAFAQVLILVGFPVLFLLGGAATEGEGKFTGGFYWQNFVYCLWEQLVGISMIYGLLGIFKKYFHKQTGFFKNLSAGAYGVYVLHPPVLLVLSAVFLGWQIPQLLKFLALAPIALTACFLIAWIVKQIPVIKKVL
ncbi:MAG: acyltransferase [Prolixibacteraceae bacterium]|nr:acyltransferase [Prolixibacteraceae bacterium]MBT6004154.1 acyltransferase [Prolixibacteraceae bacterium]MBT7001005.1 acyltransferase [Prolixibacteraceae bacterium]MBT7393707.1 acyltransferase [Prolixibacteraceae bacterium]